jgi:hypothetical protein
LALCIDSTLDMLKKILDVDIKESPEEFEERLSVLTKEQLIAEMLRKKVSFDSHFHSLYIFNLSRNLGISAAMMAVNPTRRM